MSIRFIESEQRFVLETRKTTYQIKIDKTGCLRHVYYGKRVGDTDMDYLYRTTDRGFSGNPYEFQDDRACSFDTMPQEYPTFGVGDYRVSALRCCAENGSRSTDLRYASFEIGEGKYKLEGLPYVRGEGENVETLKITLKDNVTGIAVDLMYGIFEEKDIITRAACIRNESEEIVSLRKAASVCLDIPYGADDLISFNGRHCMERQPFRQRLGQNIVTVSSKRGMSSHHNNPFVILCSTETTEDSGDSRGVMLMYSGSHKEEIEKDQTGNVRLVAGIQDEGFSWILNPGDIFWTPEAILSCSSEGLNGLSANYHRIIRENVCDPMFRKKRRPVLLNSWEASYFRFNEKTIYELAVQAKDLGAEMLVLDDGWFGSRDSDNAGLGDWTVNEKKLKGGLTALSDKIHDLGLQFGLWIEPEMVNENSDLYRMHPDWALSDPGRKPNVARNQLVLDMSRADVREYLFSCISTLLKESRIEYLKWDFNRSPANIYSHLLPPERQGEVMHRFVLGVYSLLARIREAYPDVLIEGCAGGGGRFDAGMLFYTPQIWCSDNTDPIARLFIQEGTSYGYPACTMGSHVSASPNHQTGRTTPLFTRGIVASSGILGYELNPASLSDEEKDEIRAQIETYKKYEHLIREGTYYRLKENSSGIETVCWAFVSKERDEALVNLVSVNVAAKTPFPHIKLKGLREDAVYMIEETGLCTTGAALMYGGYSFDIPEGDYPCAQLHLTAVQGTVK